MDDSGDGKILAFAEREAGRKAEGADGDPSAEAVAPGDAYATVTGQRQALSLEFIRPNGDSFTVPYSYRPLLWWQAPASLILEYPGLFSVALRGKNLAGLFRRIRDYKVTWVREIGPADAAAMPAAVTSIEIIRVYPSREEAGEPPA